MPFFSNVPDSHVALRLLAGRRGSGIGPTLLAIAMAIAFPAPAVAGTGPLWSVSAVSRPSVFARGGDVGGDGFVVLVTNTGSAASSGPVSVTDEVPVATVEVPVGLVGLSGALGEDELLVANGGVGAVEGRFGRDCGLTGVGDESCSYGGVVEPGDTLVLVFPVGVSGGAGVVGNMVRVSGGGAPSAAVETPTRIGGAPAGFGVSAGGASSSLSSVQAGAHPDLTVSVAFNTTDSGGVTAGNLKDTSYVLPAGFAGDLVDTPVCSPASFLRNDCPVPTQVGVTTVVTVGSISGPRLEPVYNLAPEPGEVAKLGFTVGTDFHYEGDIAVIPAGSPGEYGLRTTFYNATAGSTELDDVSLTVWGVPASPVHDPLRCEPDNKVEGIGCSRFGVPDNAEEVPFFTNPTACSGPLDARFTVTSWQNPLESESPAATSMGLGEMVGCDRLGMEPVLSAETTTNSAGAASGFDLATGVPQTYGDASGLATSTLKRESVVLPEGMTVNPSSGAGLGACSEAQFAQEGEQYTAGMGCPADSTLASVKIKTPSISEELEGSVFLAEPAPFGEPNKNPFSSLLALYLVARAPDRGVFIKTPGEVQLNPVTGQLTTTFDDLPPLPFSLATFSFNQGANAPLVTPPTCKDYTVTAQLTPWSDPTGTPLQPLIPAFPITTNCPTGGTPPLNPQVIAGTQSNNAGAFSPFYLRISRGDGEQEITGFAAELPPGLTGDLNGVPLCPEGDVEVARGKTGAQEEAEPSCPVGSEIGHTVAEAGVGPVLVQAPGKLYLGGPFEGAPFSVVSVTSAHVGPFDLGTVVVHLPLEINRETAQVSTPAGPADQVPHIIKGIVIHLRTIRVYIDREHFMLNPTNCDPLSVAATIVGGGAEPSNPADNDPVTVTNPFQAADCSSLRFAPSFSVSTKGHASKLDGAGLVFKVAYPPSPVGSESWFNEAKFDIPKQLPARLTTIQKACLASVFETNRSACPGASIIGHAVVHTPILPVPLEGPVYFVSYGSAKFPDAVMVLQGYGVTIELHGETFINKKTGVTSATFRNLPDVPFESIEVNLPIGPDSEFGANLPPKDNYSFCGQKLTMPVLFKASNGTEIHQNTPVKITNCPKHKQKKAGHRAKHPKKHHG